MFGRRILAAAAFVATCAQAQLTIINPSPTSWWVANALNTLAWTCNTSPYQAFNVVLNNTDKSILNSPLALIANVPNYDCSLTVSQQQSSLTPSTGWILMLTDILNSSNVYASTQFEIKAAGSPYPTTSSAASGTGTATGSAGSPSSTAGSKTGAAVVNYIPAGMSMAAALVLGLVVA